jgi:type VI secretion system protein ImpG
MDARLLRYYNQELRYLRELGSEFASEFPKIASRLGMEGLEVTDPYVERLLEGCAFLAARVQLKLDAEFPRFSHRLLELLYPNFLAPLPSMLVARITPVPDANLLKGHVVPRDSVLMAPRSNVSDTRCEFRTAQPTVLTPLTTVAADHVIDVTELSLTGLPLSARPRSSIRIRLQLPAGTSFQQLEVDSLRFYLAGQADVAMKLHELALTSVVAIVAGAPGRTGEGGRQWLPDARIEPVGYSEDEAMLPQSLRSLSGLRLLQEYFAFPERFLFVDVHGLRPAFAATPGNVLELVLVLSQPGRGLEGVVTAENFSLNCVPAINLFPKRADRIHVSEGEFEFHVVPDRTAPLDFEIYDVVSLSGYDDSGVERRFMPLYGPDPSLPGAQSAYYTIWREPRLASDTSRREGPRSGYIGAEVFISLVDPAEAPFGEALRQVSVHTRCTNRDLPVFISGSGSNTECTLDAGVPLQSVRLVAGPSRPFSALREGGVAWRLLNLLSLNYLSILDTDEGTAADALRDLLGRLPQGSDPSVRRQIEALQQVRARSVVRRHPVKGPIAFSRGIEVRLTVDELGHAGGSAYLFGAAMHHYLARHVSINSFVETVLESLTRGEVARWKPSSGARTVI